jgi:uncharacterized protein (TIGR03083 family)
MEIQAIYAAQQEQFLSLVLDHGDRSATRVPACPDWEVRDVVAHVAGLASDAATGGLPEMDLLEQWRDDVVATARDAMTAEQVRRSDDRAIQEIASDWKELLGTLAPMLRGTFPFPDPAPFGLSAILVTDLAVHDQDVRGPSARPEATTVRRCRWPWPPTASASITASANWTCPPWPSTTRASGASWVPASRWSR